jgi:ElaB/YqjD/DUF883 family membrane-anchored ribosome-binding protein
MKKLLFFMATVFSLNTFADSLQPECDAYFKEIDAYIDDLTKKSGTTSQADAMKSQYDASKDQIKQLPADTQKQMCAQSSEMLKQARAAAGI